MTGHIRSIRPARAAIAAVLAFSATPLLAQTVEPPVATPVAPVAPTAAPVMEAPAVAPAASPAPTFAPNQPVVQQVASVEERRNAAIAASEAEQTAAPVAAARSTSRTVAPRQAERAAPAVTPKAGAEQEPAASSRNEAANDASPVVAPTATTETAPPAQASVAPAANAARSDQALMWALGGGALLLLGVAGTAIVRRRRREDDVAFFENEHRMAYGEPAVEPVATPMAAPVAQPVFVEEPVRREMAPATSRVREDATLDEMVAAAPDAANPFRTHGKRLRRARFLLAQREAGSTVASAPQTTHAEPVAAPAMDRSQTIYRFDGRGQRSGFMKPRTS